MEDLGPMMKRAKALKDDEYDLGPYKRVITTSSEAAAEFFQRGLAWTYGFNHEAAIRCFEVVLELDPKCAIAHWGIAFCNGINYNNPALHPEPGKFPSNADACQHARQAAALREFASPVEKSLIDALQVRNVEPLPSEGQRMRELNYLFCVEMEKVHAAYPADPDVSTVFAESMMNIYPWALWVDGKPRAANDHFPGTTRILEVLQTGLQQHPDHPGLLHMYLHTMEMAPNPGDSLADGERLRDQSKDAGHLLHMPSHIDVQVGNYQDAVVANMKAIAANRLYIERNGADNFYMFYCCHDCHMMTYAAMLGGDQMRAMTAALELRSWLLKPEVEQMLRDNSMMANYLESFISIYLHVMVRFGRWKDILAEPFPEDAKLHCVTTCMLRYARTLAHASLRDVSSAEAELELFKAAYANVPESRSLFNNTCRAILAVALAMAEGEVAYRRGDFEVAFGHLRRSVQLDDGMLYDEPWGWMQPARHALGALLLEQGHVEEATEVYREDLKLGHHPRNVWSLHGLLECLETSPELALADEVAKTKEELADAVQYTDVKVSASCYCRLSKCG